MSTSSITRLASINVDTLLQQGRAALLMREISRYRIDVAGLQEVRWRGSGEMMIDGYKFVYSGRPDALGVEGVALCVRAPLVSSLLSYQVISSRIL